MRSLSGLRGTVISGTGAALPARLVTNAELAPHIGSDAAAAVQAAYGIAQRYWCAPDESTADLAETAARAALAAAGITASEVGLLVVATDTPEFVTPSTAAVVHGRLELDAAHAFDVSAGGGDFLTALDLAGNAIRSGARIRHALVVGVSVISKYLDVHDGRTVPVYGDGAGALLLSAGETEAILATGARTMGRHSHDVGVFAGGTRTPVTAGVLDAALQNRLRVLREYPDALPDAWAEVVNGVLQSAAITLADVRLALWAHPSRHAVERTWAHLDATARPDAAASLAFVEQHGYTGAAALPMALDQAAAAGALAPGDVVLLASAGAGVSMAAAAIRWNAGPAAPAPAGAD